MNFINLKKVKIKNLLIAAFALLFLIIAATTIFLVRSNIRAKSIADANSKINRMLDRNLAVHKYFSNVLKPAIFKLTEKYLDKDYFDHSWMSSTYVNKEVDKIMKSFSSEHSDYYYKECAVNARNPENEADTYEAAFISETNRDKSLIFRSEIKEYNEKPYMVFMRRGETMDASCIRCHGKLEEAPGDMIKFYGKASGFEKPVGIVISAISIRVPLQVAFSEASEFVKTLSGLLILEFFILFSAIYFIFKFIIFNQLNEFKNKTDLIATNESELGASVSISVGSELNDLADSFNLMSANLKNYKETLEDKIRERTAEIENKNLMLSSEVSERRLAEAELEKINRTKDKFFSIIAHDLKNLFSNIIGLSELIDHKTGENPENAVNAVSNDEKNEYISLINQSAKNASYLLSNLLTWSQSQTNGLAFNPEIVALKDIIDRAVSVIHTLAVHKNISVKNNIDESIRVRADVNMLMTILRNLLVNAIKFSKPESEIDISAASKENFVEISVKDSGIGMPPEIAAGLFVIGENIVRDGTAQEKGTGLGLALCKEFTEKHGGTIYAAGRDGEGSVFTFTLPHEHE
jgi:hypothetical protein